MNRLNFEQFKMIQDIPRISKMSLKPVHCEASDWPVVEGIGARMPCNGHHWHCSATSAPKIIKLQVEPQLPNYPASLALRRHVVAIREELQVTLTNALHCTDLHRSAAEHSSDWCL
jgi:hypothetical protein